MVLQKEVNIFEKDSFKNLFSNIETALNVQNGRISAVITESEYKELTEGGQTLYKRTTSAEMTADKINWLISSGSSKTDFTLTDRTAELLTESLVIKNKEGSKTIISGGKMDINEIFAQDITATGTIRGATLIGADIAAKRIIATKEFSLASSDADVERVLYYDGKTVRVGKLLNATGAQSGAGFEFVGGGSITAYGNLNMYSGNITTPKKVTAKEMEATSKIDTTTVFSTDWFRSKGDTGWLSEKHQGGWYMSDDTFIRAYNDKAIYTGGEIQAAGTILSYSLISSNGEYQSRRNDDSPDWRFGSSTATGDVNFFAFYDAESSKLPLGLDGTYGNIYVGYNVDTTVGVYMGAAAGGNRAFIYTSADYLGSVWIQTRLDGEYKWFSLGRACSKALSDIRLKEHIEDAEVQDAMKIIRMMKTHSYIRKDSRKKYKIGFVADELEKIDNTLVDGGGYTDGHPDYKSINELQMIAYLVQAMQEQDNEIKLLKEQLKLAVC